LPSPSLGPPLLSESPSPPPFWGIPELDSAGFSLGAGAEDVVAGAAGVAAPEEDEDEELPEPPQPAMRIATSIRPRAAVFLRTRPRAIVPSACAVIAAPSVGGLKS
jgi:hypothetical protein